jgi:phosphatidylglycerol---prolipoprotein diacylglyceryl transferase
VRSTLFYIPHNIFGWPLLGFGWLLALLVLGCLVWGAWLARRGRFHAEFFSGLPVWIVAGLLTVFLLPALESHVGGEPIGLPIRGYGVLVLLGLFAGIGLTLRRAGQLGLPPDLIINLGFWMMAGGVLGARMFYVIQKWPEFAVLPPGERWVAIIKLTEGGLVIYGGMIGGVLAGAVYCWRLRLRALAMADLIAPGFLIGSAFGRIGCLLNGCCFGGVCTAELPAITFPQGSPPFVAQLETGQVLGLTTQPNPDGTQSVVAVDSDSIAAQRLQATPGGRYALLQALPQPPEPGTDPARAPDLVAEVMIDGRRETLLPNQLPARSLPVHPSQVYSAIDSLLLCILIYLLQPWVRRDGQAFLTAVALHGLARFLLELIRSDEGGQFGTTLTIAQWISLVGGSLAIVGLIITLRLPPHRVWNWRAAVR